MKIVTVEDAVRVAWGILEEIYSEDKPFREFPSYYKALENQLEQKSFTADKQYEIGYTDAIEDVIKKLEREKLNEIQKRRQIHNRDR